MPLINKYSEIKPDSKWYFHNPIRNLSFNKPNNSLKEDISAKILNAQNTKKEDLNMISSINK